MNSPDNNRSSEPTTEHSLPVLATEGWHRFVTGFCLLACVGFIVMGVARLFDPTDGSAVPARPMDYVTGVFFILLGIQGSRFLIRQLRAPAASSTRKH